MDDTIFYTRKNEVYSDSPKVFNLSYVEDGDKYWIEYNHLQLTLNFTILKNGYFVTVSTTDDVSLYSGGVSDMENLIEILERFRCFFSANTISDGEGNDETEEKVEVEMVNHPAHYNDGKIECIEAMESAFGKEEVKTFCKLNAFKYIWRANKKGGEQDIKKAAWYLNKYIELAGVAEKG